MHLRCIVPQYDAAQSPFRSLIVQLNLRVVVETLTWHEQKEYGISLEPQ